MAACMFCLVLLNGDTTLARLSDKTTYKDSGVADYTMDAVILQVGHPDKLDLRLDMTVGPRLFSWVPRLVEALSKTGRNTKDNLRINIAFLGSPVLAMAMAQKPRLLRPTRNVYCKVHKRR